MIPLTPAERASLSRAGLITMPKARPSRISKPQKQRLKKPKPPRFDGTSKERAEKAVELAKTGLYSLCDVAVACGFHASGSIALRELMAGAGPLTNICRTCLKTGLVGAPGSVNTASLRIIRDFYELPNINGETDGVQRLRDFLFERKGRLAEIAVYAWLHPQTLRSFVRGVHGMKRVVMNRVWDALRDMGEVK